MVINSIISYGYLDLMETFFKANDLDVKCSLREVKEEGYATRNLLTFEYEDGSATALAITFMSVRHLGFENMLIDYLNKLGYSSSIVSVGRTVVKRSMKELDDAWEVRRRELGFR